MIKVVTVVCLIRKFLLLCNRVILNLQSLLFPRFLNGKDREIGFIQRGSRSLEFMVEN